MNIFKLFSLGMRRMRSDEDYRAMQTYIATESIKDLENRGIDLSALNVLELGAGRGGYSSVLNQKSAKFVATDFEKDPWYDKSQIPFERVDVLQTFPFDSNNFDLIYCSSLIEHVSNPQNLLKESHRVLKPGGTLYLSFPPFYSLYLIGGHQFKPFHLLGKKVSIQIHNLLKKENVQSYATCYGTYGLFPYKINDVKKLLEEAGFSIKHTFTRMARINTAQWPSPLKDLLTWHVCYLAQKS